MSKKRNCTFNDELQKKYPFLKRCSSKSEAFCTICSTNISLANKGRYDLEQHFKTQKHKSTIQSGSTSNSLTKFLTTRFTKLDNQIAASEGALAFHVLKHHHSFRSNDCTSKFLKTIFPDSEIAKRLSSAKTKTRAIATNVISPYCLRMILKSITEISFISISTDASNHGNIKIFPLLIQYFSVTDGISTKLLYLDALKNETSETITAFIIKNLENSNLKAKCIAFSADNTNTNFGGRRRKGCQNVYKLLKKEISQHLIGIGCPIHILHNAAKHGIDLLQFDVEAIAMKIYSTFSIYTVRSESLKEFCSFVEIEFKELLYHSRTRWLSIYPAINRILEVYPALKSYFLSQDTCPHILTKFFENVLSEALLFFVHSIMFVFYEKIRDLEREDNSIIEIMNILNSVNNILKIRIRDSFLPLKVKCLMQKARREGYDEDVNLFHHHINICYKNIQQYLEEWTVDLQEFRIFQWMSMDDILKWDDVSKCIEYLLEKGVTINDSKCFDQCHNVNNFITTELHKENFKSLSTDKKWCMYFKHVSGNEFNSEFLKIAQFFFAIPGQNANVERIFSMMEIQWSKERNKMKIPTIRAILTITYNFKNTNCSEFYETILDNVEVLNKIKGADKYNEEPSSDNESSS